MRIITCRCERSFDAEIPNSVDLDQEPGLLEEIVAGTFMSVVCPHCHETIKPDLEVTLLSKRRALELRVLPENERSSWQEVAAKMNKGAELLIGYAELYERALILRDKLDPRAVEVLKYFILAKALESSDPSLAPDVSFRGLQADGRLSFGISGLRGDELALLNLPFERYEKTASDLPRLSASEPFSALITGGYRSVHALESGDY